MSHGMSRRARAYLALVAARNAALGVLCFVAPLSFFQVKYTEITDLLPLGWWGAFFLFGAAHLAYAAYGGHENHARVALTTSAALAVAWGVSFILSAMETTLETGWVAPILWLSVAASDLVVTRQPLRTPFEDLVDKLADGG